MKIIRTAEPKNIDLFACTETSLEFLEPEDEVEEISEDEKEQAE